MTGLFNTAENFLKMHKEKAIGELQILRITLKAERNRKNIFINISIGVFAIIISIYNFVSEDIYRNYLGCWGAIATGVVLLADIGILIYIYNTDLEIGSIDVILKEKQNSRDITSEAYNICREKAINDVVCSSENNKEFNIKMYDMLESFAVQTIKCLLLINGGAAIALLTFIGNFIGLGNFDKVTFNLF